MGAFGPVWWHHHGIKMDHPTYVRLSRGAVVMRIEASAAELTVRGTCQLEDGKVKRIWNIEWRVVQSYPGAFGTTGRTRLNDQGLARAFGLDDSVDPYGGEALVQKYGATTAKQGGFIRLAEYLNIPCPGTGNDGDPNISLWISDEIKQAVTQMLATK